MNLMHIRFVIVTHLLDELQHDRLQSIFAAKQR